MNFYDKIHELVRSFKETEEYNKYTELKDKIKQNENTYSMLRDFKEKQKQTQIEYINTGKLNEDSQRELQNMYISLIANEDIKKLFEYEIKLDVLLADMQKIVAEGIKEIIEF
ncbi:MAG: YlbF family regulator [Clostridia bacterium]|nr:YlbF family regulator [Clostridia bacterium]